MKDLISYTMVLKAYFYFCEEAIKFTVLKKDFKKGLNLYKLRISTAFGENDLLN